MKTKKFFIAGTFIACCAGAIVWFSTVSGSVASPGESSTETIIIRPIPTTIVDKPSSETVRMFPGTVKARNNVDLAFSVDGVLVELKGREGRLIRKDEVLARLDERDFRNSFDAAKASFMRAESDFKRASSLFKQNVISQAEYDGSKASYDVAKAEFNIRKKALEDTILTAPFNGVIAKRFAEENEHIKKQKAVLAVKDISEIEIVIQVPERLMASGGAAEFKDIRVKFDVAGEQWFSGAIQEYSVQSDPVTRTYDVAVRLQSPTDLRILPGMTATVRASIGTHWQSAARNKKAVCLIPIESVLSAEDGKTYTWIIPEESGKPQKREVVLGTMGDNTIEVLQGLEPGTRIATAGIHSLSETMQVRPMKNGGEGLDG